MIAAATLLFAYLLGAVPMSVGVSVLSGGVDPRTAGSRNPGATNVARLNGWRAGGIALALDLAKGLVPTLLALSLGGPTLAAFAGILAVVGHCFPVYLAFRGGKGVATAAGVILALAPTVMLIAAAVWGVVFALGRRSSLAALAAALALPLLCWFLGTGVTWVALAITAVVIVRHRPNIERLIAGREQKLL